VTRSPGRTPKKIVLRHSKKKNSPYPPEKFAIGSYSNSVVQWLRELNPSLNISSGILAAAVPCYFSVKSPSQIPATPKAFIKSS